MEVVVIAKIKGLDYVSYVSFFFLISGMTRQSYGEELW